MRYALKKPNIFEIILDNIADGVFTVDSQFRVTSFNRAAEEITGYSAAEAIDSPCCEVFRTAICNEDCPLKQSLRTGRTIKNFEIDILTKQGRRQAISVSTAPLMDKDGRFLGGVETFRDLSAVKELKREIAKKYTFQDIISKNPKMLQIFQTLPNISESDATVLLLGRSGTGKELFAHAIHNLSPRAAGPMITVNCGALPETLLESELFGHVKGAFTDAKNDRVGRFQAAEGGTIFLDEIGDTPMPVQVKLLRVLENREVHPLGSEETRRIDVRVVAATNRDLGALVNEGKFREDLFYRLNVILIHIPDLENRREDIPLFVEHFIEKLNQRMGRKISGITEEALAQLKGSPFPGNVRELENAVEHAFIISSGPEIRIQDLPPYLRNGGRVGRADFRLGGPVNGRHLPALNHDPLEARFTDDRARIVEALARNFWRVPRAAEELGIHRTTLWRQMKRLKIEKP